MQLIWKGRLDRLSCDNKQRKLLEVSVGQGGQASKASQTERLLM